MDKRLFTVIKKELKRIFTDRRLVFTTMLLPALSIYIMYSIMGSMFTSRFDDVEANIPKVVVVDAPASFQTFVEDEAYEFEFVNEPSKAYEDQILNGDIEIYMLFDENFDQAAMNFELPNIIRYYNSVEDYSNEARYTIDRVLDAYEKNLLGERIGNAAHVEVFDLNRGIENDRIQDDQKATGKGIASIFPMLIAIFLFSGAMSVGPDMIAGEKERGTMATLLVTPVKRETLAIGKIISLGIVAIISAASSFIGIIASLPKAGALFASDGIDISTLSFSGFDFFALLAVMITLVSVYVAVVCMVSVISKTIKEANTYMAPIYMVILFAGISTVLSTGTGETWHFLIPVYGSVIALKNLFAFELTPIMVLYTCGSSIILTSILVFIIKSLFNNEKVMFNA